ncbi:hypothetical protein GGR52DRAFT_479238 [Hypoxylon sp. FL1284]|nr:hypothetical protein GGR52DRAFT_479238 [Hypoxylon sp. FL1284]
MLSRFCSICGVLIELQLTRIEEFVADPDHRLTWIQEVRAVRTRIKLLEPFVTGVGWLTAEYVVASDDPQCHYCDLEPQQDPRDYLKTHQVNYMPDRHHTDYWCFIVHDACWELLRHRVDPDHELPLNALAKHLFTLLYNTPVHYENETLAPGHDYGHAAEFQQRKGEMWSQYFGRLNASEHFYITGDATEEFEPGEAELDHGITSLSSRSGRFDVHLDNYNESDPFRRLPTEVVMLVLTCLPTSDVCQVRLVSRYVAGLSSSPKQLDQQFWSSRFQPDFEMGFVFAGPSNPKPAGLANWRSLYFEAKAALKSDSSFGLRNRRRIWKLLDHIHESISLRLVSEDWILNSPIPHYGMRLPETAVFADFVSETYPMPLTSSCRFFEWQGVLWPQHIDASWRAVRISSIYSNGRTYISGIRLLSLNGQNNVESRRAGFIHPSKEEEILIGPHSCIDYLDVAMTMMGVVGLRFHLRGPQGPYSVSSGEMELTDPMSGIGRLTLHASLQCVGLYIALDACKIIAISLIERKPGHPVESVLRERSPWNIRPVQIWSPGIPDVLPMCYPTGGDGEGYDRGASYFDLCLYMDFGGHGGNLLQSLVSIDALMASSPVMFLGMAFVYSDGSERLYGRESFSLDLDSIRAIRQSFPVDGPHGEFVTEIATFRSEISGYDALTSIEVTTNLGRKKHLRFYDQNATSNTESDRLIQIDRTRPGSRITAFHARVTPQFGSFNYFSTHSELLDELPQYVLPAPPIASHDIPITPETLLPAREMLSYLEVFAFTAANLSNVKSIRVSADDAASSECISGLRIEYHDSGIPIVLGQWIKELDGIELPPRDRIVELTVWHEFTKLGKRAKFGPVRRLKLGTVLGTTKTFLAPYAGGVVCSQYRESPYEKLHGILWGSSHEWDHVSVLHAPKENSNAATLLVDSGSYSPPSPGVIQKVFMQGGLDHTHLNTVSTIEVTFKEATSEVSAVSMIYKDGNSSVLGVRGREPRTLDLSPSEELAEMEILATTDDQIVSIGFLTTSGRKVDCVRRKLDLDKQAYLRTVLALDSSSPSQIERHGDLRPFPREARKFVGFWAVSGRYGALQYGRFGALFEGGGEEVRRE